MVAAPVQRPGVYPPEAKSLAEATTSPGSGRQHSRWAYPVVPEPQKILRRLVGSSERERDAAAGVRIGNHEIHAMQACDPRNQCQAKANSLRIAALFNAIEPPQDRIALVGRDARTSVADLHP